MYQRVIQLSVVKTSLENGLLCFDKSAEGQVSVVMKQ